jgi:hypothetical protein
LENNENLLKKLKKIASDYECKDENKLYCKFMKKVLKEANIDVKYLKKNQLIKELTDFVI